ncbi:MAG: serine hydrolase domain-containing protein, partial [Candidatus Rokuibacteriota bacterium]
MKADPLQTLLHEAAAAGVFPCARAVVLAGGERVFEGGAGGATAGTVFDLASLTKVMAATAVFLSSWNEGKLEPATPVARHFPASAAGRAGVTVADLLYHRAGLPAFVPFFAAVMRSEPRLLAPDCPPEARAGARQAIVAEALAAPPAETP